VHRYLHACGVLLLPSAALIGLVRSEVAPGGLMPRSAVEGRRLLDVTCAQDHHLGRHAVVSFMTSNNYGKKQDDGQP
jgi:hypothetical protein